MLGKGNIFIHSDLQFHLQISRLFMDPGAFSTGVVWAFGGAMVDISKQVDGNKRVLI